VQKVTTWDRRARGRMQGASEGKRTMRCMYVGQLPLPVMRTRRTQKLIVTCRQASLRTRFVETRFACQVLRRPQVWRVFFLCAAFHFRCATENFRNEIDHALRLCTVDGRKATGASNKGDHSKNKLQVSRCWGFRSCIPLSTALEVLQVLHNIREAIRNLPGIGTFRSVSSSKWAREIEQNS